MKRRTASTIAISMLVPAGLAAAGPAMVIEDFEGFDTSADLNASITNATPNATVALNPVAGVAGTAALVFTGENGSDPFFSQITLDTTDVSLNAIPAVEVSAQFLGGSNETLQVELLDEFGGTIADASFGGTQSLPTDTFATTAIDTSFTAQTVFSVRFTYDAVDFGTTSVAIDNIIAVPAPSGAAVIAGGLAAGCARRRR